MVCRRRIRRCLPGIHENFRRQRAAVVIGRHRRSIGAGVKNREEVADFQRWKAAVMAERIGTFAHRPDDVVTQLARMPRRHGVDPVERPVQGRAHQLCHAGIKYGKVMPAGGRSSGPPRVRAALQPRRRCTCPARAQSTARTPRRCRALRRHIQTRWARANRRRKCPVRHRRRCDPG